MIHNELGVSLKRNFLHCTASHHVRSEKQINDFISTRTKKSTWQRPLAVRAGNSCLLVHIFTVLIPHFTKWKEKQGNIHKQELYKLISALYFKSPAGWKTRKAEFMILDISSNMFRVRTSLQSLQIQKLSTFFHRPTSNTSSDWSKWAQRGVHSCPTGSGCPGTPMGWGWKTGRPVQSRPAKEKKKSVYTILVMFKPAWGGFLCKQNYILPDVNSYLSYFNLEKQILRLTTVTS